MSHTTNIDLDKVACFVDLALHQTGVYDDYDELIFDMFENGVETARKYHESVLASIDFVNMYFHSKVPKHVIDRIVREFETQLKERI